MQKQDNFALENFQGPIDFLLYLVQREEIDIYEVPIHDLIEQFISKLTEWHEKHLDRGAEFIGTAAYLVWLKSKMLVPQHEIEPDEQIELEEDPHFEIIHHLIDYCRFKQLSKDLNVRQEQQLSHFFRGVPPHEWKKPMGIDHVSLNDLEALFQTLISRASIPMQQIHEENWKVSDKILIIRQYLKEETSFSLNYLFAEGQSRIELIVIFLAILEMMKMGEIYVGKDKETSTLYVGSHT